MFQDTTMEEIDLVMNQAWNAFQLFNKKSLKHRAAFMKAIAVELEAAGDELIGIAMEETNLPEGRLKNERARTIFQLNSYADACEKGDWLEARIDEANPDKNPPKPDIRKMMVPIGPVVVLGAANFPFAYSTAGGDTASALAAGCPVIVKAHPAHARTSERVAKAIFKALTDTGMPDGVFSHVHGVSFEVGKALIDNRYTKAVGFTGSFSGGKQLYDWAQQRKEPIPVFAEMSSINPVFLLPGKMKILAAELAKQYVGSVSLGVGQFCTNPGLLFAIDNEELPIFLHALAEEVKLIAPATMLHTGIFKNYAEKRANILAQADVETYAVAETSRQLNQGVTTIATTSARNFMNNPLLHQEVFGPFSLVVKCKDLSEMLETTQSLAGQLTVTLMATEDDLRNNTALIDAVKNICGRFIVNGVPTGVEVCLSMQHGGPFPATTDSRFGSVGADAIKRFVRPLTFQNCPDEFLPQELQRGNPLGIERTVNSH